MRFYVFSAIEQSKTAVPAHALQGYAFKEYENCLGNACKLT